MITLSITNREQVVAFLNGRKAIVLEKVTLEMRRQMVALQAKIVGEKLHGQVLKNRTGTLYRSIGQRVDPESNAVLGTVFADPSVPYARIHEYGGTIHVPEILPVNAKALKFQVGGATVFAMRARAHDVKMPERSFMRTSLAERKAQIIAGMRGAIQEGLTP